MPCAYLTKDLPQSGLSLWACDGLLYVIALPIWKADHLTGFVQVLYVAPLSSSHNQTGHVVEDQAHYFANGAAFGIH